MKQIDKQWKSETEKCKVLVAEHFSIKMKIARSAINCCYRTDGTPRPSEYSLKRFASEIGLNYSTLKEWVNLTRTVWDKLDDENKDVNTFSIYQARYIRKNSPPKATKAEVNKVYRMMTSKVGVESMKFNKYIGVLESIKVNSLRMKGATAAQKRAIQSLCLEIADNISKREAS